MGTSEPPALACYTELTPAPAHIAFEHHHHIDPRTPLRPRAVERYRVIRHNIRILDSARTYCRYTIASRSALSDGHQWQATQARNAPHGAAQRVNDASVLAGQCDQVRWCANYSQRRVLHVTGRVVWVLLDVANHPPRACDVIMLADRSPCSNNIRGRARAKPLPPTTEMPKPSMDLRKGMLPVTRHSVINFRPATRLRASATSDTGNLRTHRRNTASGFCLIT